MKIRGLLIAAILFAVLSGILYWSENRKPAAPSALADSPPTILKVDQAAATRIEINKKDAPPILLTKDANEWRIAEPKPLRADQSAVGSMLFSLTSLNSERVVEDKPADLHVYGLDHPEVEVGISEKDKLHKLLIGDDTPAGGSVYAMLAGDPRVFTVSRFVKTSLDKNLDQLRDKRLLTVSADKITRIELLGKNQDVELAREKDDWQIVKPTPARADAAKVSDIVRALTGARMEVSGATGNIEHSFASGMPVVTAKVTDASGTQELRIRKVKDTYYAKSSVTEGAWTVGPDVAEALTKPADTLKASDQPKPAAPPGK